MSLKPKTSKPLQSNSSLSRKQKALAEEIIYQSLYMKEKGLTPGHSGNISARYRGEESEKRKQ